MLDYKQLGQLSLLGVLPDGVGYVWDEFDRRSCLCIPGQRKRDWLLAVVWIRRRRDILTVLSAQLEPLGKSSKDYGK